MYINIMKMQTSYLLFLFAFFLLSVRSKQEGKLVMVQELFRHGARYPGQVFGIGDEYVEIQQAFDELTNQGKAMHYLLGKKLYEVYWNKLFGGTPFQYRYNQSKFYVQSTNYNRTIESAQAHLQGIFENLPPLNLSQSDLQLSVPPYPGIKAKKGYVYGDLGRHFHPIPVHTTDQVMTPFTNGDFLARWSHRHCPNQKIWLKDNIETPKATKILNNPKYKKALEQLSTFFGKNVTLTNYTYFYDNLKCMYAQGKSVPVIFKGPNQTSQALRSLLHVTMYILFYGNQMQVRVQASDIIAATIANMKKVQNEQYISPQWIVYSAHDLTIGAILSITNLWNLDCVYQSFLDKQYTNEKCITQYPNFGSDLIFQLYKYESGYRFKINYNGVYKLIPFCDYQQECPFEKLQAAYEKWKVSDVKAACGAPYYYTKEIFYFLLGATAIMLLWYVRMKITYKSQNTSKANYILID